MKRVLVRVGLALLAISGLIVMLFVASVLAGFLSTYRSPAPRASGVTLIRYVDCDPAHPTPQCVKLANSRPVSSVR